MEINLVELWSEMGAPVRGVVIVLTIMAVACIAVTIDRVILLWRSAASSKHFARQAGPLLEQGKFEEAMNLAASETTSHLAQFMHVGLKTFLKRQKAGDDREKAAERTRRALDRTGETLSAALNRGMVVLASTGSVAPFVGLLGTVLGIINAFKLIASTGSGGIGTIGAAIGEALIVTGYGLVVAIPAVLLFNWLSGRIAHYETGLVNAASELVDQLETDSFGSGDLETRRVEAEPATAPMTV